MSKIDGSKVAHLKRTLDTAIDFLQIVRETHWASHLKALSQSLETDPLSGAEKVIRAFEGEKSFGRLYLSGPRNGHNLSERQEIEANGKLHVIRTEMLRAAREIAAAAA